MWGSCSASVKFVERWPPPKTNRHGVERRMRAWGKGCWGQKQYQCDMCEQLGKVWNAPGPCSTHIQPTLHPQSKPSPPTPLPQPLTCPLSGMWNAPRNVMRRCYAKFVALLPLNPLFNVLTTPLTPAHCRGCGMHPGM